MIPCMPACWLVEKQIMYISMTVSARSSPGILLKRALDGARETGACVVGMPSKDTVKIVDKEQFVTKNAKKELVCGRSRRRRFFVIQLSDRHMKKARLGRMDGVTDDSMLVEKYGDCKVKMVEGSYENLKITTMEDLFVAEVILRGNEL